MANLVDELLKADAAKAVERPTGVFKSKRLQAIIGAEEPVEVKIRAIKPRRLNDVVGYARRSNGDIDYTRTYDASLLACMEGIVEPDLKNKDVQKHFGAATPKDLAEILFDTEANMISAEIIKLSGISEDTEEEVKN
jgi:hypothetical protein